MNPVMRYDMRIEDGPKMDDFVCHCEILRGDVRSVAWNLLQKHVKKCVCILDFLEVVQLSLGTSQAYGCPHCRIHHAPPG